MNFKPGDLVRWSGLPVPDPRKAIVRKAYIHVYDCGAEAEFVELRWLDSGMVMKVRSTEFEHLTNA